MHDVKERMKPFFDRPAGSYPWAARALLFLTGVFILKNLLLVCFAADSVINPFDFSLGAISREIAQGLQKPLFTYVAESYEIGMAMYALFAFPFMVLFGSSLFAVKAFICLLGFILYYAWIYFMRRYFGDREAVVFAVLYIASPSLLTSANVFAWGTHYHPVALPVILALLLVFRIYYREGLAGWTVSLLGLLCGLSFWIDYIFISALPAVFLVLFLKDRFFCFRKKFILFLLSGLIGALPWVWSNLSNGFQGFYIQDEGSLIRFYDIAMLNEAWHKCVRLFTELIPSLFYFTGAGKTVQYAYFAFFLLSLGIVFSRVRGGAPRLVRPAGLLIVFLAVFLLGFIFTKHHLRIRHVSSLYPFIFAVISISAGQLKNRGWFVLGPVMAIVTAGATADLLFRAEYYGPGRVFGYSCCSVSSDCAGNCPTPGDFDRLLGQFVNEDRGVIAAYSAYAGILSQDQGALLRQRFKAEVKDSLKYGEKDGDLIMEKVSNALSKVPLVDKGVLFECLGVVAGYRGEPGSLRALSDEAGLALRKDFLFGAGYGIDTVHSEVPRTSENMRGIFSRLFDFLGTQRGLDASDTGLIMAGYVAHRDIFSVSNFQDDYFLPEFDLGSVKAYIDRDLPAEYRSYVLFGMGVNLGLEVCARRINPSRALFLLRKISRGAEKAVYSGFGHGIRYLPPDQREALLEGVPVESRDAVSEGARLGLGIFTEKNNP